MSPGKSHDSSKQLEYKGGLLTSIAIFQTLEMLGLPDQPSRRKPSEQNFLPDEFIVLSNQLLSGNSLPGWKIPWQNCFVLYFEIFR